LRSRGASPASIKQRTDNAQRLDRNLAEGRCVVIMGSNASSPKPGQLDRGIGKAVECLQASRVEAFESCEAGAGHAYPEPTIRFHGSMACPWGMSRQWTPNYEPAARNRCARLESADRAELGNYVPPADFLAHLRTHLTQRFAASPAHTVLGLDGLTIAAMTALACRRRARLGRALNSRLKRPPPSARARRLLQRHLAHGGILRPENGPGFVAFAP
jgi:hypothetical protein